MRLILFAILLGFPLLEAVVLVRLSETLGWWILAWVVLAVFELARAQHALARAARAVAAAVRQPDALADRGLEDGLPGRDGERVSARLESDLAGFGQSLSECGGSRLR